MIITQEQRLQILEFEFEIHWHEVVMRVILENGLAGETLDSLKKKDWQYWLMDCHGDCTKGHRCILASYKPEPEEAIA